MGEQYHQLILQATG